MTFNLGKVVREYLRETGFLAWHVDLINGFEKLDPIQIFGQVGQQLSGMDKVHFKQ